MINKYFLLIFFVLVTSCQKEENDDQTTEPVWKTKQFDFNHNGLVRTYILHKPENFVENSPLVFVLHGFTGSASNIMSYSQMNKIAWN